MLYMTLFYTVAFPTKSQNTLHLLYTLRTEELIIWTFWCSYRREIDNSDSLG